MMKLLIQGYVSAKSVVTAITWLLLIMALVILLGVWYFLTAIDNQVERDLNQRVELAFTIEEKHKRDILGEYTYWDASYEHIFEHYDSEWIALNSGAYLLEEFDLDFSVAVRDGQDQVYVVKSDDASAMTFDAMMKNGLSELIRYSNLDSSDRKIVSGFIQINHDVYFIIGGPLINEQTDTPRTDAFLALGKRIDEQYLDELESNYQLFGLNHHLDTQPPRIGKALNSVNGAHLSYLSWTPHLPSAKILLPISLVILFVFIGAVLITREILNRELNNRNAHEEKLYLEATTDHLTKINNRRYFMDMGNKELYLCHSKEKVFSLLLLDIDHFKTINDTHGYQVGDKVLVQLTQLCAHTLRQSDIFGRIGGEEFGIVLPDANGDQAREMANRLRTVIMQTPFIDSSTMIPVTVSIGIATFKNHQHFESVIAEADSALYQAKTQGRNRVISLD